MCFCVNIYTNMNTLEQMTEKFALLPEDFQEAIRTFDYDKRLQNVSNKFKLHIDQLVVLEQSMADIVFGDMRATNLPETLSNGLRISREQANEISIEINSAILVPLKDHIKSTQTKNYTLAHPEKESPYAHLREVL